MSRVQDYINDIRHELADPRKERWTDNRLISLLSDAQAEIAHELRCLISRVSLSVIAGVREYTLPEDADILLRVHSTSGPIEKVSHYDMDAQNPTWEFDTGSTVQKVVYDLLTPNKIVLYPIPTVDSAASVYTFEAGDANAYVGSDRLGVVTGIDNYTFGSQFGEVSNLFQPGFTEVFSSQFGVVTDIREILSTLTVQYSRRPAVLTSLSSKLELSESFKLALVHFACFRALSADLDTKSAALAQTHYSLYNAQMKRLQSNSAASQSKGDTARTVKREVF